MNSDDTHKKQCFNPECPQNQHLDSNRKKHSNKTSSETNHTTGFLVLGILFLLLIGGIFLYYKKKKI